jgi:YD repeat-containing protein
VKYLLLLLSLYGSTNLFAQHTPQEIKKLKISRILKNQSTAGTKEVDKYDTRYDQYGNETATYIGGEQYSKIVYTYTNDGKIIKAVEYSNDQMTDPSFISDYTYAADGSYTMKKKNMNFPTFDYAWYDKDGRLLKTKAGDAAEEIYTYDVTGKLLSIKSAPGTTEDIVDFKYLYDAKGRRIKEISAGSYPWTRTYTYDAKGILLKCVTISTEEGVKTTMTDSYKYEFWK